jgi:hypothetical protein
VLLVVVGSVLEPKPLVLPLERGGSSAVGRGRVGSRTEAFGFTVGAWW